MTPEDLARLKERVAVNREISADLIRLSEDVLRDCLTFRERRQELRRSLPVNVLRSSGGLEDSEER